MFIDNNRVTRSDVNQKILASCAYLKQSPEEDWINQLKKTCLTQKQAQTTVLITNGQTKVQQSLMSTVDDIMDALAGYTVLFNQDADFELYLSVTAPSVVTDSHTDDNRNNKARASYVGRISSRSWSLVVAAREQCIEFSLLPSSQLLHYSRVESLVEPFIRMSAIVKDQVVRWQHEDELLFSAELPRIYQDAFKVLIEAIYSDMDDILEKRNLERRSETDRRRNDRRQQEQSSQSSPFVERRKSDRRSAAAADRREFERRKHEDGQNRVNKPNLEQWMELVQNDLEPFLTPSLEIHDGGRRVDQKARPKSIAEFAGATVEDLQQDSPFLQVEEFWNSDDDQALANAISRLESLVEQSRPIQILSVPYLTNKNEDEALFSELNLAMSAPGINGASEHRVSDTAICVSETPQPADSYDEADEDSAEDLDDWIRSMLEIDSTLPKLQAAVEMVDENSAEATLVSETGTGQSIEGWQEQRSRIEDWNQLEWQDWSSEEEQEGKQKGEEEEVNSELDPESELKSELGSELGSELESNPVSDPRSESEPTDAVNCTDNDEGSELVPGSEEHAILQFLSQLALRFESGPSKQSSLQARDQTEKSHGSKIGKELVEIVNASLSELILDEEVKLSQAVKSGSRAFSELAFETIHPCLAEAVLRTRALELLTGLRTQWIGFANLDKLIDAYGHNLETGTQVDLTVKYSTASRRLKMGVELLMKSLLQMGAHSFQMLNFDEVHTICKQAASLQRFQRKIDEVCGWNSNSDCTTDEVEVAALAAA